MAALAWSESESSISIALYLRQTRAMVKANLRETEFFLASEFMGRAIVAVVLTSHFLPHGLHSSIEVEMT